MICFFWQISPEIRCGVQLRSSLGWFSQGGPNSLKMFNQVVEDKLNQDVRRHFYVLPSPVFPAPPRSPPPPPQ